MAEYVFRSRSKVLHGDNTTPRLYMDFMDLDSDKWRQYAERRSIPLKFIFAREHRLLQKYELNIHRKFDGCFFVSDKEVDLFVDRTGTRDNILAVGNGVTVPDPVEEPQLLTDREEGGLLFTGVMDYFPNEDAMLWFCESVWPIVLSRHPDTTLVIAGMNPSPRVRNLEHLDGVAVTGFLESLEPLFNSAKAVIIPLKIARGIQNKVLEAFAHGVPVVSTPAGAEGIECVAGQHLLVAEDAEAFADAVCRLLIDDELATQLSNAAHNLIRQRYDWESANNLLESCLSGSNVTAVQQ